MKTGRDLLIEFFPVVGDTADISEGSMVVRNRIKPLLNNRMAEADLDLEYEVVSSSVHSPYRYLVRGASQAVVEELTRIPDVKRLSYYFANEAKILDALTRPFRGPRFPEFIS